MPEDEAPRFTPLTSSLGPRCLFLDEETPDPSLHTTEARNRRAAYNSGILRAVRAIWGREFTPQLIMSNPIYSKLLAIEPEPTTHPEPVIPAR